MSGSFGCAGDGFSPRAEDAISHGCIPVVVMDDVDPVFSSILDWSAFSIRIAEVAPRPLLVYPQILNPFLLTTPHISWAGAYASCANPCGGSGCRKCFRLLGAPFTCCAAMEHIERLSFHFSLISFWGSWCSRKVTPL